MSRRPRLRIDIGSRPTKPADTKRAAPGAPSSSRYARKANYSFLSIVGNPSGFLIARKLGRA